MTVTTQDVKNLKSMRSQARKGNLDFGRLTADQRAQLQRVLDHHIAAGTATREMLQLSRLHGFSV